MKFKLFCHIYKGKFKALSARLLPVTGSTLTQLDGRPSVTLYSAVHAPFLKRELHGRIKYLQRVGQVSQIIAILRSR